jgi:hypothetical protein
MRILGLNTPSGSRSLRAMRYVRKSVVSENQSKKEETHGIYQAIALPIFFLFLASFVPETSLWIAVLSGIYCALSILFVFISKARKWHRSIKFRTLWVLIQLDTTSIFIAVLTARVLEGSIGVFLLVTGIFLLGILTGHRFSQRILDELHKPKTRVGKLLIAFGSLGGGLAGLLSYWFSQFVPGMAVVSLIDACICLVLVLIHAAFHQTWQ